MGVCVCSGVIIKVSFEMYRGKKLRVKVKQVMWDICVCVRACSVVLLNNVTYNISSNEEFHQTVCLI